MIHKPKNIAGSSALLISGFLSLITLMAVIAMLGVQGMRTSSHNLEKIIVINMSKMQLLSNMLQYSTERRDLLHLITNETDPFKRDDAWMQFNLAGNEFATSRARYLALGIDYQEKYLLEHQSNLTKTVVPLQLETIDMALNDNLTHAHHLLMHQVAPAQQQVSAVLMALQAVQELKADQSLQTSVVETDKSGRIILILSALFVTVALFISAFVVRKNNSNRQNLHQHIDEILAFNEALTKSQIELQDAKQKAEDANKAKSQFLAKMSHELRTPLNAIIGYGEILFDEATDDENSTASADLQKIISSARHLLMLINDILDISKVEAGKMELYLTDFKIERMIEQVRFTVEPLMRNNNNQLEIQCEPDIGNMLADEMKCEQILINLLSNSSKFSSNGIIKFHIAHAQSSLGDRILLDIMDSGIGMSHEEVNHLFEAFVQADSSTSSKFGGTGLGLAITKHFVNMMQGDISVNSRPGKGTHFRINLPRIVERRQQEPPAANTLNNDAQAG